MASGPVVVGIGLATLDLLAVVPRYPEKNTKNRVKVLSTQGGGPTATAIAAAAKLGERTRFIGKVGDDDNGGMVRRGLEELGVDVARMVVAPGGATPFSFVAIDESDASRTIFHHRDLQPLTGAEIDWSCLDEAGVLLADCRQPDAQIEGAKRCRARGVPVLLDAEAVRDGVMELCGLTDVLIASEHFAQEICRGPVDEQLKALAKLGPKTVVVTLGEQGSAALVEGRQVRAPAFRVKAVDTTGCGDAYHGAYAVGLVRGYPVERCMEFASAVAALNCRALGGRAGLPAQAEVEQFVQAAR